MRSFKDVTELKRAVGSAIGPSRWLEVDQATVDRFAEATGDRQWIHTDPDRAKTGSPYGQTVAHGFLTLSLAPTLLLEGLALDGTTLVVNYGLNKVRFPAPVLVGSKLRLHLKLQGVTDISGGVQLTLEASFQSDRQEKPVCVAEMLFRYYTSSG